MVVTENANLVGIIQKNNKSIVFETTVFNIFVNSFMFEAVLKFK